MKKLNLKKRAKKLKKQICAVYLAFKHKDTPILAKCMAAITIGYALSPIDLIPDFIPVLGYLDDIILLPLFIYLTLKLIPEDIMEQCYANAEGMWQDGKPVKWFYGIPIILCWIFLLYLIISYIWPKLSYM